MNPVCVDCQREMDCKLNGVVLYHKYESDRIYFIIRGDLYRCSDCGFEVVADFGEPEKDRRDPRQQEYFKQCIQKASRTFQVYYE